MPEGPSIVILKQDAAPFVGEKIIAASGTAAIDTRRLVGRTVVSFRSWGKHFLIELPGFAVRIHFMLFGKYRINEAPPRPPQLRLQFGNGEISFQAGSIRYIEGDLDTLYDWRSDVMAAAWDPALARTKLRARPDAHVCDALLDQEIFSGVGNIIKNEVLFRIRVHPLSRVGALPARKLTQLIDEARRYSFEFFEWKRAGVLKRHWRVHTRTMCPRCKIPLHLAELGVTRRRSFFCTRCQILHRRAAAPKKAESSAVKGAKKQRIGSARRRRAEHPRSQHGPG